MHACILASAILHAQARRIPSLCMYIHADMSTCIRTCSVHEDINECFFYSVRHAVIHATKTPLFLVLISCTFSIHANANANALQMHSERLESRAIPFSTFGFENGTRECRVYFRFWEWCLLGLSICLSFDGVVSCRVHSDCSKYPAFIIAVLHNPKLSFLACVSVSIVILRQPEMSCIEVASLRFMICHIDLPRPSTY